jgi:pectin methylesterase-like acyl-CoA thioesterase
MKTRLLILSIVLVVVGLLPIFSAYAQTAASATWPLTSTSTTAVTIGGQVTGSAETCSSTLYVYNYSGQTGPSGSAMQLLTIVGGSWTTEAASNHGRYFQFTVSPATNNNLTVDTIAMVLGGKGGGNMKADIWYSLSGFTTDSTQLNTSGIVALGNGTYTSLSYGGLGISVPQGKTISVRIYPFYAGTSSGKYIAAQNVVIKGSTTAIPVAATATWPLLSTGVANVSGLVSAGNISYDGTNLYHYGYNATNGDRWTNHLPSNGAWPSETSPNFSRYAQVSLAPLTGGTMYVDTIKFNQVVEFTTTLRMAIYYSNDPTFATQTFIADTTVPTSLTSYQYAIAEDTIQTGGNFYLRFYPYDNVADAAWKLVDVNNVVIVAKTTGVAVSAPTVTTTAASYISNTFFTSGGNVTADGGGTVTAKGVCWNTTGMPTTSDSYVSGGTGVGSYTSSVTGLAGGITYYLRAYATNIGGTSYGSQITVTTLSAVVVPTLTTTAASSIMSVTAKSGGSVTAWGGASVTAKGICWNTIGTAGGTAPTITDTKTVDGSDIGSFSSALSGLAAGTTYYVRAYGTNSAGTGYGPEVSFTTQTKSTDTTVVVAKDGSGNYTTIGDALRNVPTNYTGTWRIFVKKGNYHEKDTLASGKVNVVLEGEDRDSTLLWNCNYSDDPAINKAGTSATYTITIDADDFIAKNITFENTYWPNRWGATSNTQAVAVSTNGDRQQFLNCAFNGYQDTYYTRGSAATGRAYHKNCIFKGTVDYVFGRNICVFDSCTFMTIRYGGTITAGGNDATSQYGYVFRNCTLLGDTVSSTDSTGWVRSPITASNGWLLGRPWQGTPRAVYLHCYESANIAAAGWTTMSVNPALYTEFDCYGPGATTSRSIIWSATSQPSVITQTQANQYTLTNIFARNAANSSLILYDWYPSLAPAGEDVPLPVELTSFAATAIKSGAMLTWKTATEKNNYGFNVERRAVGTSAWTKLSFVAGNGTSNTAHSYSYVDTKVNAGTYVYRIAQVDNDGSMAYSNEAQVAVGVAAKILTLANYPNPFNPTTTIQFSVPNDGKAVVKIYNVLGQEMVTAFSGDVKAGQYNQATFDGAKFSSGVYFYTIESSNQRMVKKMMLLK